LCSTARAARPAKSRAACVSPRTCARARAPWIFSSSRCCRVIVCAPAAEQAAFGDADRRIEGYALPVDDPAARYVVVSTQGRGDEAALLAALAVDVDYVAFVGSRKKAEALKAELAKRGAGLDLGAITPDEIAISILAEIVAVRRGKDSRGAAP
jgi:xanthine dehydrogenase accessory factor